MPPAQALHFAAEFKVTADLGVREDAEAVDNGRGPTGHFDHLVGVELQVGLMADGQDHRIGALECLFEVRLDPQQQESLGAQAPFRTPQGREAERLHRWEKRMSQHFEQWFFAWGAFFLLS
jgi:hypothetical protein